ncbi:hypothetical protein I7I50_00679 [Histoplasma capsulatum G186AR]|uniref:Uncharacterized protein n=1 Tax=Ajellomyces capsulatus TaxID=5037 RepID=A0A8H7YEC1_AJECA|nr:hypothetical protein I7I52_07947 [Histoplasma capsulatum]QSS72743.1 hypothetical protein I7I50_00679 [Histoplasma capsulatum G186AR]
MGHDKIPTLLGKQHGTPVLLRKITHGWNYTSISSPRRLGSWNILLVPKSLSRFPAEKCQGLTSPHTTTAPNLSPAK